MDGVGKPRHLLLQASGGGKRHAKAADALIMAEPSPHGQFSVSDGHATSHRESDDNYRNVIHRMSGWRVIVCRDGRQWIIQNGRSSGRRGAEWKGGSYCTTLGALLRDWRRHTGDDGAFLASILPDRIRRQT